MRNRKHFIAFLIVSILFALVMIAPAMAQDTTGTNPPPASQQVEGPAPIKTVLAWTAGAVAVIVALRITLWPQIKGMILDVVAFRKELKETNAAVMTTAKATSQLIDENKKLPQTGDVDPRVEMAVKSVAVRGTGSGSGPGTV